eukprot:1140963-Pelagomonas_calceolata.AAC.1
MTAESLKYVCVMQCVMKKAPPSPGIFAHFVPNSFRPHLGFIVGCASKQERPAFVHYHGEGRPGAGRHAYFLHTLPLHAVIGEAGLGERT